MKKLSFLFGISLLCVTVSQAQLRKVAATKSSVPVKMDTSANSKYNLMNRPPAPATTTTSTTTSTTTTSSTSTNSGSTTTQSTPPPANQTTSTPPPPPPAPAVFQFAFSNSNNAATRNSNYNPVGNFYNFHGTDYDADGIMDLTFTDGQYGDVRGLWLKRNTSNNTIVQQGVYAWDKFNAQTAITGGRIAISTDLTGDGRTDFIYIHKGINYAITVPFLTAGDATGYPVWQYAMKNYVNFPSRVTTNYHAFAGDFNGDGKGELTAWYFDTGAWEVALSDGNTLIPTNGINGPNWINQFGTNNVQPFTGDFNGDRYTDIGLRDNATGNIYIALNNRSNGFVWTTGCAGNFWLTGWQTDPATIIRTGDFNGDKKTDLLAFNPNQRAWQYILSNGNGCFTSPSNTFLNFGYANTYPFVADVNADGKDDIIAGTLGLNYPSSLTFDVAYNISQ